MGNASILKFMDRTLGFLLCRLLSVFSCASSARAEKLKLDSSDVKKILLIRPGGIGDMVLALPLIDEIRKEFPNAAVTMIAERRNHQIVLNHPGVSEVVLYDSQPTLFLKKVFGARYDVLFDTEQFHYLASVTSFFVRAKIKVGFCTHGRGAVYDYPVDYLMEKNEIESFLELLEAYRGQRTEFDPDVPFMNLYRETEEWARKELESVAGKDARLAAVCVGASIERKRWPVERYEVLVKHLLDTGRNVILLGGEADTDTSARVAADIDSDRLIDFTGRQDLLHSAALVQACDVFIGSDSGLMHIAYALGIPTLCIFGPGSVEKWAPRSSSHITMTKNCECSPCTIFGRLKQCDRAFVCMTSITAEDVISKLDAARL